LHVGGGGHPSSTVDRLGSTIYGTFVQSRLSICQLFLFRAHARLAEVPMIETSMGLFAPVYNALHSTAGVLVLFGLLGIGVFALNRRPAGNLSQRLMRWRVGLQLAVILAILAIVLLRPHAPTGSSAPAGGSAITKSDRPSQ
jgi:hypothetical protein